MKKNDVERAIAVLDRFIEHPWKWNSPTILWGQPDVLNKGKTCGVSGMISLELIAAATDERERLTARLKILEASDGPSQ